MSRNFKFHLNLTRKRILSCRPSNSFLHRMRNVPDRSCTETQNTHFVRFFFFEDRVVCEIMWNYIVQPDRPRMKIWRMHIACWVTKAANTHIQNMQYYLFVHCNNDYTNAPQCNVMRALRAFIVFERTRAISTRIPSGLIEIYRDLSKLLQRYYFALCYDSFLAHHFQLIIRSSPYHSALYKLQFPKDS